MPLLSPYRLAGVAALFVAVLIYDPAAAGVWQRLGLPVLMALGAWLTAQSLLPVLLGALVLATIHGNPGAGDPFTGIIYPALAGLCGAALLGILYHRFRQRMERTRAARWQPRRAADASVEPEDSGSRP